MNEIEARALESGAPPGYLEDQPDSPLPKMLHGSRKRLRGHTFRTLTAYRTRRAQVKRDADLAEMWLGTAQQLEDLGHLARRLSEDSGVPRAKKARLKQSQEKLSAAWLGLWGATSSEQVKSATERPITEAAKILHELAIYLNDDGRQKLAQPHIAAMQMTIAPTSLLFDVPRRIGAAESQPNIDYAARAQKYRDRLGRSRWAIAAVAFVVAVFTGLIALYFGKTWGTATDYVTAFLWGLTTQTAVTGLLAILAPDSNPLAIPSAPVTTKRVDAAAAV